MTTKVFLLETGTLTVDRPMPGWCETPLALPSPVYALCIVAGSLKILVDTGLDRAWFSRSCPGVTVVQREDQTIDMQLERIGIRTDEIETVINTHLHVDNCGGNRYFPGARFIMSRTELRHGYVPDAVERLKYEPHFFENPGGRHTLLDLSEEETFDLVPGIAIVATPGHSSGHLSVIVHQDDAPPIIYTGDAIIREDAIGSESVSGNALDPQQAMRSIERLEAIAGESKGSIIYPHDPASVISCQHLSSCTLV